MKVKHVLMIAAVLLAMFVAPVVAEDTTDIGAESDAVYSFQIPDDFDFKSTEAGAKQTDKVSVDIESIDPKNVVEVSVTSSNAEGSDLYLKHVSGTGYRLLYTMTVGGNPVGDGGVVISTDYDAEEEVIFTLEETATKSGRYEDTLTFTAQMVAITSNDYAEKAVYTCGELQAAIDAATGETTITLGADITGDVTVPQEADVKITIDGAGKTFNGVILVDGKSQCYDTAALTLRNINFAADLASHNADAIIRLGDGTDPTRYTNHVTVKDCTFTDTNTADNKEIVAIKSYTGGDKNLIIDGCTVNTGMHSLAQLKGVDEGLKVTGCTVNSKNGLNVNNGDNLDMSDCTFNVKGYAVRFGSDDGVYDRYFSISDSTLKSACDEAGDAVIEFRAGAIEHSTLTLTDTTLEGTPTFKGNTEDTTIIQVVDTEAELLAAIDAGHDVILTSDIAVTSDTTITVGSGKDITLDLNGHTLSSTNTRTATHNFLIDVKGGTLTVKDGKITYEHTGANMGWNGATTVIDVTAGGVLNMDYVTVKFLGGTDMNFAVHMNNWGEVTLNANNCVFEGTYCAVRVNNSGPDMNTVTIKNSVLNGGSSRCFWVHNYVSDDFGGKTYSGSSVGYDKPVIDARLNLNIFNNGNTFTTTGDVIN